MFLRGTITLSQSGPESNGNEEVFCHSQTWITGVSTSEAVEYNFLAWLEDWITKIGFTVKYVYCIETFKIDSNKNNFLIQLKTIR